MSGKVAREVEKKLAFGFEPMGEQRVKNLAEPIPVYRVKLGAVPGSILVSPSTIWPSDRVVFSCRQCCDCRGGWLALFRLSIASLCPARRGRRPFHRRVGLR